MPLSNVGRLVAWDGLCLVVWRGVVPDIVLYTRVGCHLCEEADAVLKRYGLQARRVDIDGDRTLRERLNTCVPVVEIDGKVRFRGKVNEVLLRRLVDRWDD